MKKLWSTLLILGFFAPQITSAHAFGQKYTLALPVWLYIYGGGAVIIISFLLIGYFTTQANPKSLESSIDLSRWRFFQFLLKPRSLVILKSIGVILFLLTLLTGIFGNQRPTENFAPTFFWLIFTLGFTYLTAIVGNLWSVINPWKTLVSWIGDSQPLKYPARLGYLPALLFYFILIWLELLSGGAGVRPESLAMYLAFYTVITVVGTSLFGIKDWFKYCDFFSVFFRLISKLAPVTYSQGKLILRWPFVGLLEEGAENMSLLLFIVFMLSSTAFDGFRETTKASRLIAELSFVQSSQDKQLILMLGVFILFLLIYLLAIWIMKLIVKTSLTTKQLALSFAFSLIPIVLAYNLAHYYTLLLVQGQSIIASISDPFNLGWNLFGTADRAINVGIIGAKAVWESQVAFILIGHIAAVYIAHILALRIFQSQKRAFVSQLPMLMVMVIYTMVGLWILSQPLTIGG